MEPAGAYGHRSLVCLRDDAAATSGLRCELCSASFSRTCQDEDGKSLGCDFGKNCWAPFPVLTRQEAPASASSVPHFLGPPGDAITPRSYQTPARRRNQPVFTYAVPYEKTNTVETASVTFGCSAPLGLLGCLLSRPISRSEGSGPAARIRNPSAILDGATSYKLSRIRKVCGKKLTD